MHASFLATLSGVNVRRLVVVAGLAGLTSLVSACSTAGRVADAVNPFNDGQDREETAAPEDDRRVSLLSLSDELTVDEALASETVTPPSYFVNPAWPGEGGFPSHALGHPALGADIERAWRRDIGAGSSRRERVTAPPVMGGGRVFAMDGAGRVSAYDAQTGSKEWDVRLRADTRSDREARGGGVAYWEDKVYVTMGFGAVLALDATTGEELWRRDTSAPMHAPPTVWEGRLFAISFDNELFALSADTGAVLWTFQSLSEPARILTANTPAVVGDTVIAPFASGELVALRVENGREIWNEALGRGAGNTPLSAINDIAGSPVVSGGVVYAMSHSGLLAAFDLRTGQRLWEQAAGGIHMPWVAGEYIFLVTNEAKVAAVSRRDGRVYWIRELDRYRKPKQRKGRIAWAGPVLAGERLYLTSSEGELVALDPTNGETLLEERVGGPVFIPPIVAQETLFLLTDEAKLVAYR